MATRKKKEDALMNYGDFSLDEADEMEKEAQAHSGGGTIFKLAPGKTVARILPPKAGEKLFKVAYVHYIDVPGVGRTSFNCPRLMAKRPCKVCRMEAELLSTGEDVDFKKSRKLKAKRQLFVNMIVRSEEETGPRPFRFGKMIEDQLIEIRRDEDDGGNFAHPIKGFDLKFSRKGEGAMDTEYKVVSVGAGASTPISEDAAQMREWLENQPDLSRFLRVLSDEEIDKKLRGEEGDDDDRPRRRKQREEPKRSRKSSSIEDEIEDIELGDEEDDDLPY